jgi:hypothetical protein
VFDDVIYELRGVAKGKTLESLGDGGQR